MTQELEITTAVTMQPLAAWEKVDNGWICVHCACKDLLASRLSNEEFNRRFPVSASN